MHKAIRDKEVPHCLDEGCGGLVKPEIVFFGEQLPADFFHNKGLPAAADLCIIMGTSLSVHPFAGLPQCCSDGVPRLLINQEQVGTIGSRSDDVLLLGDCDDGVRRLATSCGWLEELEELWKQTAPTKDAEPEEKPKKSKDEQLEDEVEKLTKEVEETLKLSENQHKWLETHVDRKIVQIKKETAQEELHEATGEPAKNQEIQESNPINQDSEEILRPVAEAEEKSNPEPNNTDSGGDGLQHIFPHLAEKPSL
jgi:NAD+-dependent protein deacetylase SIR2